MTGRALNSQFVRLMRTGPVDGLPLTGGGGQGQGQQQQGGQQGAGGGGPPPDQQGQQQQQSGQGDPFGGLLDQARQQQAGDQQQGQGQQGGQQGQQSGPLTAEDVARIVESAVDRRINAIANPGGGRNRQQQNGNQQQQGQQNDQQQVARVDQGARREARLAFREYVGDQIRFLSDVERAAANQIGTAMIATWDGDGDADGFGREVASKVAATVRDLGEMYKRTTIEALRKQGLLKEQPSGPGAGSALAGFPMPTGGNGFTLPSPAGGIPQRNPAGALQTALAMADQYNQQAGHAPAGQQQT